MVVHVGPSVKGVVFIIRFLLRVKIAAVLIYWVLRQPCYGGGDVDFDDIDDDDYDVDFDDDDDDEVDHDIDDIDDDDDDDDKIDLAVIIMIRKGLIV